MSSYPIAYRQDPPERRNRLTVFFRLVLAIPHLLWVCVYGIAFFVAVVLAWFAIAFTGRWPAGMYTFCSGFLRYSARLTAYVFVVVDAYPPFDGAEHPEYPVQLTIAPAQEQYSRARTLFRIVLAIPIYVMAYIFQLWASAVAIAIWVVAVILGRTPKGLSDAMLMPLAYIVRSNGYFYLVVERWPPLAAADAVT